MAQIFLAPEEVKDLSSPRIEHHRIDRKIPPGGRIFRTDIGIEANLESLVPRRGLRVAARSMRPFRCWKTISDHGMSKWISLWQRKWRLRPSLAMSEASSSR